MKTIKNIVTAITLIGVVALTSCGGDNPTPEQADEFAQMVTALANTWSISSVTQDNSSVTGDWSSFSITLTENKTFTTTANTDEQKLVWPTSGSYSFPDETNANKILRSDGVELALSDVSESSVTITFNITERGGRAEGLIGEWVFVMEP